MNADVRSLGLWSGRVGMRTLLALLARRPRSLVLAGIFFVIKDSPTWLLPLMTGNIIDVVVSHRPLSALWLWTGLALVLLLQNYPTATIFTTALSRVSRDMAVDIRNSMTERLQMLSIGYHSRANAGVIQSKLVRDVESLELLNQQGLPAAANAVLLLGVAIVVIALRVPYFVVLFVVAVPLTVALVSWVRKRSNERNEAFRLRVEEYSRHVGEMANLIPITRAHGLEGVATIEAADSADTVRATGLSLDRLNGQFGALSWVTYQALGITCLAAAAAASLTHLIPITAGEVVMLSTYFTLVTNSIVNLVGLAPLLTRGLEALRSIGEVMGETDIEENRGKGSVDVVRGQLDFIGATVTYPGQPAPALHPLKLSIPAGQSLAIVGSSGSGKSTLVNLALGFLRPSSGKVLLDGRDMADLDLREARRFISVVPQETILFEGTIRQNISYGLAEVDDERLRAALEQAHAIEFVEKLPAGWDTRVGSRGAALSGGQRQRIAIARALIRDPRILFLDEATSALDVESEREVRMALNSLIRTRTTLMVAHRLSTIRSADRIVVLENGVVVEDGTHDDLMARGGRYRHLHDLSST